ncbi:MAG: hypothetical protein JNN06_12180 [Gemmobacter sp.]|uniref:hypothetical protein n=1 Tax=Gemmobacter sp. TaxID=1898957 RepID=UPI001A50E5C8|nr:hypothetical protein [Gemmobacter sp.]MBL8563027.1 hypothetical protein [Gemmobacter sp.]
MFRTFALSLGLGLTLAGMAHAATPAYDCTMPQTENGKGWIAPQIIFAVAGDEAVVYDGVIHNKRGKPISAKVVEDTEAKLAIRWEMGMRDGSGNSAIMRYKATLLRKNNVAIVTARPAGYDNKLEERGTCKEIDLEKVKK